MPNQIPVYQIDAFASHVFAGNPAAVCPLAVWLDDRLMQQIAFENNLSETAFFTPHEADQAAFDLRWFTPAVEVDLCGHATLASAFVVFTHIVPSLETVTFHTRFGALVVRREGVGDDMRLAMNFPVYLSDAQPTPPILSDALGVEVLSYRTAPWGREFNGLAIVADQATVEGIQPDLALLERLDVHGLAVTAPGEGCDCASRYFAPRVGIPEDPVTGSAHCMIAPYWAERLGKTSIHARQVSKRGGDLYCAIDGDRIRLSGQAVQFMSGQISLP